MRNDKKSHMQRANKAFQDRTNVEDGRINEIPKEVYHMVDLHPNLTKKIQGL